MAVIAKEHEEEEGSSAAPPTLLLTLLPLVPYSSIYPRGSFFAAPAAAAGTNDAELPAGLRPLPPLPLPLLLLERQVAAEEEDAAASAK